MAELIKRFTFYDFLAIIVILVLADLSIACWNYYYPLYFDTYDTANHLAIARGFQKIGGITLHNFWEFPVTNNPHYYPFLLHILTAFFLNLGCPADMLAKWGTWLIYPLSLLSTYLCARFIFNHKTGLYCLILLSLPWLLVEKIWGSATNGLFLIILPLVLLALVKKRYLTTAILVLLDLSSHVSGLVLPLIIFIYIMQQKKKNKGALVFFLIFLLFSLPFFALGFWRVNHYSSLICKLDLRKTFEIFQILNQNYAAYFGLLSIIGLFFSYKRKGTYLILPSLLFAFLPFFWIGCGFRFLYPNGFLFLAFSGSVVISELDNFLTVKLVKKNAITGAVLPVFLVLLLTFIFPLTNRLTNKEHWPVLGIFNRPSIWQEYNLLIPHGDKIRIAKLIETNCSKDEFAYMDTSSNVSRGISAFSQRSVSTKERQGARIFIVENPLPQMQYIDKVGNHYVYKEMNNQKVRSVILPKPLIAFKWLNLIIIIGMSLIAVENLWIIPIFNTRKNLLGS